MKRYVYRPPNNFGAAVMYVSITSFVSINSIEKHIYGTTYVWFLWTAWRTQPISSPCIVHSIYVVYRASSNKHITHTRSTKPHSHRMNVQQHFVIVTTHDFDRLLQFVHAAWIVSILLLFVVGGGGDGYGVGLCERKTVYLYGAFLVRSTSNSYW